MTHPHDWMKDPQVRRDKTTHHLLYGLIVTSLLFAVYGVSVFIARQGITAVLVTLAVFVGLSLASWMATDMQEHEQ